MEIPPDSTFCPMCGSKAYDPAAATVPDMPAHRDDDDDDDLDLRATHTYRARRDPDADEPGDSRPTRPRRVSRRPASDNRATAPAPRHPGTSYPPMILRDPPIVERRQSTPRPREDSQPPPLPGPPRRTPSGVSPPPGPVRSSSRGASPLPGPMRPGADARGSDGDENETHPVSRRSSANAQTVSLSAHGHATPSPASSAPDPGFVSNPHEYPQLASSFAQTMKETHIPDAEFAPSGPSGPGFGPPGLFGPPPGSGPSGPAPSGRDPIPAGTPAQGTPGAVASMPRHEPSRPNPIGGFGPPAAPAAGPIGGFGPPAAAGPGALPGAPTQIPISPRPIRIALGVILIGLSAWSLLLFLPAHKPAPVPIVAARGIGDSGGAAHAPVGPATPNANTASAAKPATDKPAAKPKSGEPAAVASEPAAGKSPAAPPNAATPASGPGDSDALAHEEYVAGNVASVAFLVFGLLLVITGAVYRAQHEVLCRHCHQQVIGWKTSFGLLCPMEKHYAKVSWVTVVITAVFWLFTLVVGGTLAYLLLT
jgi:hypothetical protein